MKGSLHVAFVFLSLLLLVAANAAEPKKKGDATAYIVFVVPPPKAEMGNHEAYHLHFLALVLGSEGAAREALIYNYDLINGFAAWLTKKQASKLSKQPGVIAVMKDTTSRLFHGGSSSPQPDVIRAST